MAYVTRTELRTYLGITSSVHDTVLDSYANAASEACDMFTGRINGSLGSGFLTHSIVSERHWITDEAHIVLGEWPVVSITSATLRGDSIVQDSDYFLRTDAGIMTFFVGSESKSRETGSVAISYVAGYESVPESVKNCCCRLASYWFARRQGEGMGAQLIADIQETFRLPESAEILQEEIGRYRLNAFGVGGL